MRDDLRSLLRQLRSRGAEKIILLTLPPVPRLNASGDHWNRLKKYNEFIVASHDGELAYHLVLVFNIPRNWTRKFVLKVLFLKIIRLPLLWAAVNENWRWRRSERVKPGFLEHLLFIYFYFCRLGNRGEGWSRILNWGLYSGELERTTTIIGFEICNKLFSIFEQKWIKSPKYKADMRQWKIHF